MKTLLAALSLLTLVASSPHSSLSAQAGVSGTWQARLDSSWSRNGERQLQLELRRDEHRQFGTSIPFTDLRGLGVREPGWSSAGEIRFSLVRDAGTFDFRGTFDNGRGAGTYTFMTNRDFAAAMAAHGAQQTDDASMLRLALHDVSRAFIAAIEAQGYKDVSVDNLVRMRIHGATPEFLRQVRAAGFERPDIDTLVRMRIHGVSPEFITSVRELGYRNFDIDDLVRMRIHGVSPKFIKEMKDAGYADLSIDRLVQFRIHGVDADFVRKAHEAGFKDLDAQDLVDLSIHGRRWMDRRR
jgi:hypothetical protein